MKLYKYENNEPIYYYNTLTQVEIPSDYKNKDVVGLWVSNVANIDLPIMNDIISYKQEIKTLLHNAKTFGINTLFFQVRTTNDAFYISKINPTSRFLMGKEGMPLEEDILPWIIEEAKKQGMEFHAWCNPYRVSYNGELSIKEYLDTCDELNFAKIHPETIVLDKNGKLILNPALEIVQNHIIDSMVELASKYDIDGIHFDDYFYPYSGLDDHVNDLEEYNKQSLSLGDFRRDNVNKVIKGVYDAVKKVNKNISFGVSPFGIWKNKKIEEYGSNTDLKCSESYYGQYADSIKWIEEGYIDYIIPQIYWEFGHSIAPFADICDFWIEACKDRSVKLYIGHALYRLGTKGEFLNPFEVVNQLKYANNNDVVKGNVFFTYSTLLKEEAKLGTQEVKKLLKGGLYETT